MKPKHSTTFKELVSQLQIERDEMAYLYVRQENNLILRKKLEILAEYTEFTTMFLNHAVPLVIREDAIDFILKNNDQLKGKFTMDAFVEFSKIYNLVFYIYGRINDFLDLKTKYNKLAEITRNKTTKYNKI
jgi:hypothetical protein